MWHSVTRSVAVSVLKALHAFKWRELLSQWHSLDLNPKVSTTLIFFYLLPHSKTSNYSQYLLPFTNTKVGNIQSAIRMNTRYLKLRRNKQQRLFCGQDIVTFLVHTTTHNGLNVKNGTTLNIKKLKITHLIKKEKGWTQGFVSHP